MSKLKDVVIPLEEVFARAVLIPEDVRAAMSDSERDNRAVAACAANGITDPEQVDIVCQALGLTFLGMIKPSELGAEINAFLDLNDPVRAGRLAEALRKDVLGDIESKLIKYYMPLSPDQPSSTPQNNLPTSAIPLAVPGSSPAAPNEALKPKPEFLKPQSPEIPPPPVMIKVNADVAPIKAPPPPPRISGSPGTLIGPASAPRPSVPPAAPARIEFGKVQQSSQQPPAPPGRVRTPDAPPPPRVVNYGP